MYTHQRQTTCPSKTRNSFAGQRRYLSDLSQQLPSSKDAWTDFLSNNANKHDLTNLIADFILSRKFVPRCPVYVTKNDTCSLKEINGNVSDILDLHSTHREADPRIAFHAVFASSAAPQESVCVASDDTDVFIILLSIVKHLNGRLYFRQGYKTVGKGIEYHDVSALEAYLGDECCRNLLAFHALTGSDFTYPFFGRGKNQSFSMMMNLRKSKTRVVSVGKLDTLGTNEPNVGEIIDFILHTIYNRPKSEKCARDSRAKMIFTSTGKNKKGRKYRPTTSIPPDESSLRMKILRCNWVTYNWKNSLNPNFCSLDATKSGWTVKTHNNVEYLATVWYEGNTLPTDEEYSQHIIEKQRCEELTDMDIEEESISEEEDIDSDVEYESDYAQSEVYSSEEEDDDNI